MNAFSEKQHLFPDLDMKGMELFFTFMNTHTQILNQLRTTLAGYDLSQGRFYVLLYLHQKDGEFIPPSEIAEFSCVTRGTVSGLIDGLEKDGFITRSIHTSDRRMISLKITPAGNELLLKILPLYFGFVSKLLSALTVGEREELDNILKNLAQGLEEIKRKT